MIKITLKIKETNDSLEGKGESFGRAALNLLNEIVNFFGPESLDDGHIFECLSELCLSKENKYKYFDFSCPEDRFELVVDGR